MQREGAIIASNDSKVLHLYARYRLFLRDIIFTMTDTITFGDRVTHKLHPEWGSGAVLKVENAIVGGKPAPRVTVRFFKRWS